jgi:polygalacturonase
MKQFFFVCALIAGSFSSRVTASTVIVYPPAPGDTIITTQRITVNGIDVPIVASDKNYAHFAFEGSATVRITNVQGWKVSPEVNAPPVQADGNAIEFTLTQPRKLIIHNSYSTEKDQFILLFAEAPEIDVPDTNAANVLTLPRAKMDTTGVEDASYEFQKAVNTIAFDERYDILYVGPGTYNLRGLILNSNTQLYLAPGSKLSFTDAVDIPNTRSTISSGYGTRGCVVFNEVENARIYGRGVLEANNKPFDVIKAYKSKNISIEGVIGRNSQQWHTVITRCVDVNISNYKVIQSGE